MKPEPKIHMNCHANMSYPAGVYGHELEPGDVLETSDVYNSTSGAWESCPCPGLKIQDGAGATWVRPVKWFQVQNYFNSTEAVQGFICNARLNNYDSKSRITSIH